MARELIIKNTHRALWYEDGVMKRVLEAGRYKIHGRGIWPFRRPLIEVTLVDVRERDLAIKGQEILTADKVAIRVSILVQFRVIDPESAVHNVANYEERIYSDVQLAARRSLASMNLEEILTNRNKLSEEILAEVQEKASSYGISILNAAVKDLIFPGNLQEIMNRVLAAERRAEAELIEARAKADRDKLEAQTLAETRRLDSEAMAVARKLAAESEAAAMRIRAEEELRALAASKESAAAYVEHPALLRLRELETLTALGANGNARIYIGFDKHAAKPEEKAD